MGLIVQSDGSCPGHPQGCRTTDLTSFREKHQYRWFFRVGKDLGSIREDRACERYCSKSSTLTGMSLRTSGACHGKVHALV